MMRRVVLLLCICVILAFNSMCVADESSKALEYINRTVEKARAITNGDTPDLVDDDSEVKDQESEELTTDSFNFANYEGSEDSVNRLLNYLSGNIYGSITVDVTPVVEYLDLLMNNGIDLKFKEIGVSQDKNRGYEWINLEIGNDIWMIYTRNYDGSGDDLNFCISNDYRPQHDAFVLMLVSLLKIDKEEAERLYQKMQYNIIDECYCFDGDGYRVEYSENQWFHDLIIRRSN